MTAVKRICVISDLQMPYEDRRALKNVLEFIKDYQPDEVYQIGDLMDYPTPSRWSKGTREEFQQLVIKHSDYGKKHFLEPLRAVYDGPVGILEGNHDCLDAEARALTGRGFKHWHEIADSDVVLTVDDEGAARWQPITEVVHYEFAGTLNKISNSGISALLTDNHRVVGLDRDRTTWIERTPVDLPGNKMWVYSAGRNTGEDAHYTDLEIRLAAWALTDAYRSPAGKWVFYQSGEKAERIRKLLADLGFDVREIERTRDTAEIDGKQLKSKPQTQYEFHVGTSVWLDTMVPDRHRLPEWIFDLSARQARIFLDEYVFTDGTEPTNGSSRILYVCREGLREDLMILCTMNGLRCTATEYREGHWRLNICDRAQTGLYRKDVSKVEYEGVVWCLKVPNGRFFVERDGKVHLTGNSRPRDYLSQNAPALAEFSDAFHFAKLLDFDGFGIKHIPPFTKIGPETVLIHGHEIKGMSHIPGTMAYNHAAKAGVNVVCGHSHRLGIRRHTAQCVGSKPTRRWGFEVGNLMDVRKAGYLGAGGVANWQQGFGILYVDKHHVSPVAIDVWPDGSFVIEGQRYGVIKRDASGKFAPSS